jgi:mannonate dehydratase
MFIQDQLPADRVNDENLSFYKAIGVDYLTVYPPPTFHDIGEMSTYFIRIKELAESHGLLFYNVAVGGPDEITLGQPGRDAAIEQWCNLLRAMGKAGVPTLGYNFKPVGNFRTTSAVGRGGAKYSTFDYEEYAQNPPHYPEKEIGEEELRANLEYFLRWVVPVAEDSGVTMALHPDDPPIPKPMGGAARIVSTLDQYERIFDLVPSPSNAMLFCQGCVAEMGEDVPAAIRRMGGKEKIVYVHFRNIRGNPRSFREVFVDEGQEDMFEAMQAYKEIGFNGPFMMDHTPQIPGDREAREGHAYAVGYIRAMIQAVYR